MSVAHDASAMRLPLALAPEYRPRVWGGARLRAATPPIGELWAVYDGSRIIGGPWAGRTLRELVAIAAPALLGAHALSCAGGFPLLIKLLDTADWLSVQVHPDDAQAVQRDGPGVCGKAEAWHVIEGEREAELIGGVLPGTTQQALERAIRNGGLLDLLSRRGARAGETFLLPPGTLHALGPGLLVYEVQQPSDITYRVFDWDRPVAEGRALHRDQALAVSRADGPVEPQRLCTSPRDGDRTRLLATRWFNLDLLHSAGAAVPLDTCGETPHALTAIAGAAELRGAGWRQALPRLTSVLVPAACGAYEIVGQRDGCSVLLATPGDADGVR
jgi:mannose-6-phosphate isomerase